MNEQIPPSQPSMPPPPPPGGSAVSQTTSTGLDPKLAGLLCYILGIITGFIFFLIEKTNHVVRFHAAQSIVFSAASIVLWIVLFILQVIFYRISWTLGNFFNLLNLLIWLGLFIVWIVLLIKGYSGEKWKLPVLGDLAERLASGGSTVRA